jgi:hypothetical protein
MMKVLKYIGVLAALALCYRYVPYGDLICLIVNLIALWHLVNSGK